MNSIKKWGIDYIFKSNPDIVCLQELPINLFEKIKTKYNVNGAYIKDFKPYNSKFRSLKGAIATFTKHPIISNNEFEHFSENKESRFYKFMYKTVNNSVEVHKSIVTKIDFEGTRVDVLNTRLSCALGINDHLEMLENSLQKIDGDIMLVCGDLNTPEPEIVNKIMSWARNFEQDESKINARAKSEELFKQYEFNNTFTGTNTSIMPYAQFDHILVPENIEIISKKKGPLFLSDHNMLFAELSL